MLINKTKIIRPPGNGSTGRPYVLQQMFFYFATRSLSSVSRSPRNFALWSVLAPVL